MYKSLRPREAFSKPAGQYRLLRFVFCNAHLSSRSGHAVRLVRWLLWISGLRITAQKLCESKTLNEQRELWSQVRRVLMNRMLHWIVMTGDFLWKAAGVPPAQKAMIVSDHLDQGGINPMRLHLLDNSGEAMYEYIDNTLDPVAKQTLLSEENYYYLLTLQGKYSRRFVHIQAVLQLVQVLSHDALSPVITVAS